MALDATIATPPVSLLCQFKTFKRFKPLFPPGRDSYENRLMQPMPFFPG
jgi:hypothetical protein